MSDTDINPYQTPSADLEIPTSSNGIMAFKRFSAWGVFGLSIITFGIYPVYWLYSRASVINTVHDKKISSELLVGFVLITILSLFSGFFGESSEAVFANIVITLVYLVVYLMVLFKVRNRLQDVMGDSSKSLYSLNPVFTFFLTSIYFQYKVNQRIDEHKQAVMQRDYENN